MPGWKRALGEQLDALIGRAVPDVHKAVRWNQPLYGIDDGWFVSYRCFTQYVKVTLFRGATLDPPPPPGAAKQPEVRFLDVREGDEIDEAQFLDWVRQASVLPGVRL